MFLEPEIVYIESHCKSDITLAYHIMLHRALLSEIHRHTQSVIQPENRQSRS